jgi:hypothetical protein
MKTIFTLEMPSGNTWYIDFDESKQFPYQVSRSETAKTSKQTFGEALEYIFTHCKGFVNFKTV